MANIDSIEGVGASYADKLKAAGISTTEALLEKGASAKGREAIVAQTGISDKLILRWVNHADLFRLKGVGAEFAELLEAAGVDTVPELAQRNAANLCQKMATVNEERKLVRKLPTEAQVTGWIAEAKGLPKVVTHGSLAQGKG
jgi:predicted flap endonuclease-1-like 5' DNA nuclease